MNALNAALKKYHLLRERLFRIFWLIQVESDDFRPVNVKLLYCRSSSSFVSLLLTSQVLQQLTSRLHRPSPLIQRCGLHQFELTKAILPLMRRRSGTDMLSCEASRVS